VSIIDATKIVFPKGKPCLITSSINMTGFSGAGVSFEDATIACYVHNGPCIDALSTEYVHWKDVSIWAGLGNAALYGADPTYGIQIGRVSDGVGVTNNHFDNVHVHGYFQNCAFYNYAAESTFFDHVVFGNYGGNYALCQDGYHLFNVGSAFVTQHLGQYSQQSFIGNTFIDSSFMSADYGQHYNSATTPIYISRTTQHRFINSYACATCNNNGYGVWGVLLDFGGGFNDDLYFDMNIEARTQNGPSNGNFYLMNLQSPSSAIDFKNFTWISPGAQLTSGVGMLKVDSNIPSVTASNLHIDASGPIWHSPESYAVLADPSKWTINGGKIVVNAGATWSAPASFSGQVCNPDCVNYVATYTPASSSAACLPGRIDWNSSYIYVCVGANTWKRAAISTF